MSYKYFLPTQLASIIINSLATQTVSIFFMKLCDLVQDMHKMP